MAQTTKWTWVSSTTQEAVVNGCVCTVTEQRGTWFATARVRGQTFHASRTNRTEARRAAEMMTFTACNE